MNKDKNIIAESKDIERTMENFEKRSPSDVPAKLQTGSPSDIAMAAINKGYDTDFIEKMLQMQERFEANEARKAYHNAMANFRLNLPLLKKDKYNKQFDSWYTSLGNLLDTYNTKLGENGLSISFPPQQNEKSLTVECRLSHRLGHSESVSITAAIDPAPVGKESGKAARNPIQNIKSTFTYLRSATCEAILGVSGTDASVSDNGNLADAEYISAGQVVEIDNLIVATKADKELFLTYLKVESIEEISANLYNKAIGALKAKAAKKGEDREPGQEG